LLRLTRFEWVLWDKGILHVAGVDEAGLSPLAGPASAAASFPVRVFPALMIQKKLNAAERERLAAAKHPATDLQSTRLSRAGACSGGAGCMFHSSHLIRAGAV
jgi:hypothetical protein